MAARKKSERVTLLAPSGARVTVSAGAAEKYLKRGYEKTGQRASGAEQTPQGGQAERKPASPAPRSRGKRQ